ncbi:unnamed protein product [Jaminaea pallidilutea]
MAGGAQKLTVLHFHGYTSNTFILHRRLGSIRKACRNVADFHGANGPLLVQPITSSVQSLDAPDDQKEVTEDTPIEEQPRAWWRASDDGSYRDIEQSWKLLSDTLAKVGHIDGVIGFSQGACLAGMVAAAFEAPHLLPGLKIPETQRGSLKFAIAISGFRSRDPQHQALFDRGVVSTPVLNILGRNDQIVDEERAQTLVAACKQARVEYHPGGHVVPSQAPWRNFMRDWISSFMEGSEDSEAWKTVAGPAARMGQADEDDNGGDSGAPSGTSTPNITKKPGL